MESDVRVGVGVTLSLVLYVVELAGPVTLSLVLVAVRVPFSSTQDGRFSTVNVLLEFTLVLLITEPLLANTVTIVYIITPPDTFSWVQE
jgi:hypothetical protein